MTPPVAHTIEPASSGRAKCRGCGERIAKDELRFGERLPNPFADGDMTIWFHLTCGAYRRPESMQQTLTTQPEGLSDAQLSNLSAACELALISERMTRLGAAQRASSGRAKCRHCQEPISKDTWRLPLIFFEEGVFNASGFIHAHCAYAYTEHDGVAPIVEHFSATLAPDDLQELLDALKTSNK